MSPLDVVLWLVAITLAIPLIIFAIALLFGIVYVVLGWLMPVEARIRRWRRRRNYP